MHWAALRGFYDMAEMLLRRKARSDGAAVQRNFIRENRKGARSATYEQIRAYRGDDGLTVHWASEAAMREATADAVSAKTTSSSSATRSSSGAT